MHKNSAKIIKIPLDSVKSMILGTKLTRKFSMALYKYTIIISIINKKHMQDLVL